MTNREAAAQRVRIMAAAKAAGIHSVSHLAAFMGVSRSYVYVRFRNGIVAGDGDAQAFSLESLAERLGVTVESLVPNAHTKDGNDHE